MPRAVEDCLTELFQSLGINRAHLASGQLVPGDWLGLVARHSARIASLTLVSPRPRPELHPLGSRLMVVAGDKGPDAEHSARLRAEKPTSRSEIPARAMWPAAARGSIAARTA